MKMNNKPENFWRRCSMRTVTQSGITCDRGILFVLQSRYMPSKLSAKLFYFMFTKLRSYWEKTAKWKLLKTFDSIFSPKYIPNTMQNSHFEGFRGPWGSWGPSWSQCRKPKPHMLTLFRQFFWNRNISTSKMRIRLIFLILQGKFTEI